MDTSQSATRKKSSSIAPDAFGPPGAGRPAPARHALLLAALEQLGQHGCRGTSVRAITRAAGARNSSALHYHFKSKAGLIAELIHLVQERFDADREAQFVAIEQQIARGEQPSLRAVLEALVFPYVHLIEGERWGLSAVRFLAYIELEQDPRSWRSLNKLTSVIAQRTLAIMRVINRNLSEQELSQRLLFFVDALISGFAGHQHLKVSFFGDLHPKSLTDLANFYIACGERLFGESQL